MIITLSGKPASGKSTVALLLAQKLGYPHYSAGDMQRGIAKKSRLSITKLNELEQHDDSVDRMVDEKVHALGSKKDAVVDSWLGPHFLANGFHVFLDADDNTIAKRRMLQLRAEESLPDKETAKADLLKRMELNRKRWMKFYKYDFLDMDHYDLVIDTSKLDPDQVVQKIIKALPSKSF